MDITKKVKYEKCQGIYGKFYIVSYKGIPIAEIKPCPGWLAGKKIDECFKVFYCEDHPVDYIWINDKK